MFPVCVYMYLHLTYIESTDLSQKTLGHPLDFPPRTIPPHILSCIDNLPSLYINCIILLANKSVLTLVIQSEA